MQVLKGGRLTREHEQSRQKRTYAELTVNMTMTSILGRGILGGLLSGHQHAAKVLPKYKGGLLNKALQSRCSREQLKLNNGNWMGEL